MVKVEISNGNRKRDTLVRVHLAQEKQRGQNPTKAKPYQYEAVFYGGSKGPKRKLG